MNLVLDGTEKPWMESESTLVLNLRRGRANKGTHFEKGNPLIGYSSLTDAWSKTAVILPTKWLAKETFRFPYQQNDEW